MTNAIKRIASFYLGWRLPFILLFSVLLIVGFSINEWWSSFFALAASVPMLALYALTGTRVGEQNAELSTLSARLDAVESSVRDMPTPSEPGYGALAPPAIDVLFVPDNAWHARHMAKLASSLGESGLDVAMANLGDLTSSGGASAVLESIWRGSMLDATSASELVIAPRVLVVQWPYGAAVSSLLERSVAAGTTTVEVRSEHASIDRLDEAPSTYPMHNVASEEDLRRVIERVGNRELRSMASGPAMAKSALGKQEEDAKLVADADDLAALAGRHHGERCVIIGNGPSLNDLDLTLLRDEVTIGVNSIFLADSIDFPLSYYVVEDSLVMRDNIEDIKRYRAKNKLFPSLYRDEYEALDVDEGSLGDVSYFNMNGGYYVGQSPNFCVPRFSTDASQRLYCGQSVTIINLQLAYYMGFSEVYVIGMDFSYTIPETSEIDGNHILSTGDDPNHFHKDYFGKGKTWKDPKLDRVLNNYQLAKVMFEADGRNVYNATAGGKLELFERRDFHDVFGE